MQCQYCGENWPERFKVCPLCAQPLIALSNVQMAAGAVVSQRIGAPVATGTESIAAGGHVIVAGQGAKVIIGDPPIETPAVDVKSALSRYLKYVISQNRYLPLQGIRSGGKLVSIELEQIYVTLRVNDQRLKREESRSDTTPAPAGVEKSKLRRLETSKKSKTIPSDQENINRTLKLYPHLVVLGDPGSGKTTLLRYLVLLYAQDLAQGTTFVQQHLELPGTAGFLPLLLPLRRLGAYLAVHRRTDDGTEGCSLLLEHFRQMLAGERVVLPAGFFDSYLESGKAVVLFDGLDEVADPDLRRRVARMVEAFTVAYPKCRFVVTSRIVGYTGAAQLGWGYVTTTIQDFTDADIALFLRNWHLAVGVGQLGPGEDAAVWAEDQTRQLLSSIAANERVRELAINPLLLTVIALVHRDRVKLPDRRAELYAEAIDVLLGKWDEVKGVQETVILENHPFDAGDRRLLLQKVALKMHESHQKEIGIEDLAKLLYAHFYEITRDDRNSKRAVIYFLNVIEERTGLLLGRGEGIYTFSHLTFQEYFAARAIAGRDDYVDYTLRYCEDSWWREAILLEAGYLSTQSRERTTRLIQAIADYKEEKEIYYNLTLAAEALRDVGGGRVTNDLEVEIQKRLRAGLEVSPSWLNRLVGGPGSNNSWIERRSMAMQALARVGAGFWSLPYGEPQWIKIPAGEFFMGTSTDVWGIPPKDSNEDEFPQHRVVLPEYRIAKAPITNAQYQFFIEATGRTPPSYWKNNRFPKGYESCPVVEVTWSDALAYCTWLSKVTKKQIVLPSEAEWEKAARGDRDRRVYPWGNQWDALRCNNEELGIRQITPVGIFPEGASPYGVLDLSGNVSEWTRSLYHDYPYKPFDWREDLKFSDLRTIRGGAYHGRAIDLRCTCRSKYSPELYNGSLGFRVVEL